MNRTFKAVICRTMSAAILFSMALSISSCGNSDSGKPKKITKKSPWFNSNVYDIDCGADHNRKVNLRDIRLTLSGADDKYLVVYSTGSYDMSIAEMENGSDFEYFTLNVIDRKTMEVVNTIDLTKAPDFDKILGEEPKSVVYYNGIITATTNVKARDYDPLTGEMLDSRKSDVKAEGSADAYKAGDYQILAETCYDEVFEFAKLHVISPEGITTVIPIRETNTSVNISYVIAISDTKALVVVNNGREDQLKELDLVAAKLTDADPTAYEWLDTDKFTSSFTGADGSVYCSSSSGLSKINAGKKTVEETFNFNWCGINKGITDKLAIADCFEDSIILLGLTNNNQFDAGNEHSYQIIELKKADRNPYEGRTVLELFALDIYPEIGEAIEIFNSTNEQYFIEVTDRYDKSQYFDSSSKGSSETEKDMWRYKGEADFSNALAMDIINGQGPDILINTSTYGRINNSSCLVDLTPYVKDLDPENYYTNIIEGAKTDGVLYQLPVSYKIHGIVSDKKYAGSSGVGFTFDEYSSFVKETLNGTDIIYWGQATYFTELFNYMDETFISGGKVDLSSPEFAKLAEFVKDNVSENGLWDSPERFELVGRYGHLAHIYGYEHLLSSENSFKDVTILGMPSVDGRGPKFDATYSVAVSKEAVDTDACGEFVKILLSDEIQTKIADNGQFVINRKACSNACESEIERYNKSESSTRKFTSDYVNKADKILSSCSKMNVENSDICVILIEEMPAYFLGQKDLDSVIKIAESRIQKVLDERG